MICVILIQYAKSIPIAYKNVHYRLTTFSQRCIRECGKGYSWERREDINVYDTSVRKDREMGKMVWHGEKKVFGCIICGRIHTGKCDEKVLTRIDAAYDRYSDEEPQYTRENRSYSDKLKDGMMIIGLNNMKDNYNEDHIKQKFG